MKTSDKSLRCVGIKIMLWRQQDQAREAPKVAGQDNAKGPNG